MELIRGLHNLRERHRGCVATIGAFDGMHLGHTEVIRWVQKRARACDLPAVVIVFEPLPREYFSPHKAPSRLMSFREKFSVLRELGVDRVLRIRFDETLANTSADSFCERVFVDGLDVRYVVVGDDLRFGRDRAGDFKFLSQYGERFGFEVARTVTVEIDGERVSSTRIRRLLEVGDFARAERLLGRPYAITGKVVYGRQMGKAIGVPTANLQLHRIRAPLSGVYVVEVNGVNKTPIPGVANVGVRPTLGDGIRANLEVHMLDFEANLYGRSISVRFLQKIRDEKKFDSIGELKSAIDADIAIARDLFDAAG